MARYFFNLTNGSSTINDSDGEELPDMKSAKAAAVQAASDLARNKPLAQIARAYVCVTDEQGKEVFRTPLVPFAAKLRPP